MTDDGGPCGAQQGYDDEFVTADQEIGDQEIYDTKVAFLHSEAPLMRNEERQQQQYAPSPQQQPIRINNMPAVPVQQQQQPTVMITAPVLPQATPQPVGAVEWKMLEMDVSAAASLKELDSRGRVWEHVFSDLIGSAGWDTELGNSRQRIGGLEILEAAHNFPFQVSFRFILPNNVASTTSNARMGSNSSNKNTSSGNKLPTGKYIVTSKEPSTFTLRVGQKIKSKNPIRILVAPSTLERSILSSYGTRENSQEPIWTPKNLRQGISPHPRQKDTISMVDVNHPIMHQIELEKKRQHGDAWRMDPPNADGLYQVANADLERHIKFLQEDWAKSIKMQDLMGLRIQIERSTVAGETSGDALETIWTNPAEICDGFNLTSKAGIKAKEKITQSPVKYRFFLTIGLEYANVL